MQPRTHTYSLIHIQNGPHFVSGGDSSNPCEFTFSWETLGACPVHPIQTTTCQIQDPAFNYTFDLSPLQMPEPSLTQFTYFNVSTQENFSFHLAICGHLDHSCHNNLNNVTVCQTDSNSHEHVCGRPETQRLRYFDGSLSLQYSGGDTCHSNKRSRSVLINFECDRSVYKGWPRYISEEDCGYTFVWPTALACRPRELECVAAGGKYDLRPLLESQSWSVAKGSVVDDYEYVIGGCRSLDFTQFPRCPQNPWMGACRWNRSSSTSRGEALGYIMGDLVEVGDRSLKLTYYNGDTCKGGSRPSVVVVDFQCGTATGVPTLISVDSTTCTTRMEWVTRYACPRDNHIAATGTWVVEDPVSHHTFNLTNITHTLSGTHTDGDTTYNYTIGLAGQSVPCPRSGKQNTSVGACQTRQSDGRNHALGFVDANSTLDYVDGEVIVEYRNGDSCHHLNNKPRRAVISFECELDQSRSDILEIFGENECEYVFHVHTHLVCAGREDIGVECALGGYSELGFLTTQRILEIQVPEGVAYVSVCQPIASANPGRSGQITRCPPGSAACLIKNTDNTAYHLGKPTSRTAIQELDNKNGVSITYTLGSYCTRDPSPKKRYSTTLLLVCNWNVPVGAPEYVSSDDQECHYVFKWETKHACALNLSVSALSKDVCHIYDTASNSNHNFTTLVQSNHPLTVSDISGNTYYIQLCGTSSPGLSSISNAAGCDSSNTGVCRRSSGGGSAQTLVYAEHKFVETSHSPHVIEVVFPSGATCDSDHSKTWKAFVRMACATGGEQTPLPIFQHESDCELHFVWQNSSFCVGTESCSAEDPDTHNVYNLDSLMSSPWTGVISPTVNSPAISGGSFTMAICSNLNPFASSGNQCSSPSSVCLHTTDGKHINLGQTSFAPEVVHNTGIGARVHIAYSHGDVCSGTRRYHTDLYIQCAPETSPPQLLLPEQASTNCSWAVTMNSPIACVQTANSTTNCAIHSPAGNYDFSQLGKTSKSFTIGNITYTVCLCNSSGCPHAGISMIKDGSETHTSLGTFYNVMETGSTNGPRFTFHDGDSCGEHGESNGHYRSFIFMECNRTADKTKGNFILQEVMSSWCEKYFFWSTPFACLSEEVNCALRHEATNTLYDFSPLHSHLKPWSVTDTTNGDTYYINICGPIKDSGLLAQGCSPDAAICLAKNGQTYDIAIADTQQLRYNGLVHVSFNSPTCPGSPTSRSYVSIQMVCGASGLTLVSDSDCKYHFTWKNPYACVSSNTFKSTDCSTKSVTSSDNYKFFPTKLHRQNSYTLRSGADTYYVNLCGPASECGDGGSTSISACLKNGTSSQTLQLASTQSQPSLSVNGRYLLYQMSSGDNSRHIVVTVKCLVDDDSPDQQQENTMALDNIVKPNATDHTYYYFIIYTKQGCQFIAPTVSPNNNNNGDSNNGGNGNNHPSSKSAGGTAAAIIITLVALTVVGVILVAIFYKKDRRDRARKVFVHLFGGKSSEVVRYHKLSSFDKDEETALMGEDSEEEGGSGSDGSHEGREKQQSDEEMIDL